MRKKRFSPFYKAMAYRFLFVIGLFCFITFLLSSNVHQMNSVSNINGVKSIQAIHIITEYDNRVRPLEVMEVSTMEEASIYGPTMPISFTGQMTAYNPICVGCTGKVSCPPRQDVTNGNIYYEDEGYGSIRILAADPHIPCGTVVQITNVTFSEEPIIGIVLDRGGAIKGNIMDFLVTETDDMDVIGRQRGVHYEVLRWGW